MADRSSDGLRHETTQARSSQADEVTQRVHAARRDPEEFIHLDKIFRQSLYYRCYRAVHDIDLASDLTQNILLKAFRNLHKCRPERFEAWLGRIAENEIIDHFRWVRRHIVTSSLDCDELPELAGPTTDNPATRYDGGLVEEALRELTGTQRRVVELRAAGYRVAEIARTMGKSEEAVKQLSLRAHERIKQYLKNSR
jgi:RNA polymerase sigma-70 factor (ECF subfamily)